MTFHTRWRDIILIISMTFITVYFFVVFTQLQSGHSVIKRVHLKIGMAGCTGIVQRGDWFFANMALIAFQGLVMFVQLPARVAVSKAL